MRFVKKLSGGVADNPLEVTVAVVWPVLSNIFPGQSNSDMGLWAGRRILPTRSAEIPRQDQKRHKCLG